jgi:hypothetical protein
MNWRSPPAMKKYLQGRTLNVRLQRKYLCLI